ncbi:hypothetical protein L207DRAFT_523693 [Hyaloscypha variabilis F]|uniref:Uncharacterized protein n=1 Tax=Hyaloscypha variabilis (strain UAMH 11265 / GT02V1 / F) TaxID=1149755 RepID=A0A2J6S684_HYAVF|nr:hypothetical protein L207DRAFT_523693 [Hyaloscypha variabilis F]
MIRELDAPAKNKGIKTWLERAAAWPYLHFRKRQVDSNTQLFVVRISWFALWGSNQALGHGQEGTAAVPALAPPHAEHLHPTCGSARRQLDTHRSTNHTTTQLRWCPQGRRRARARSEAELARTACSAVESGVVGKEQHSDIFAFSQHLDDIAGSDQAVGAVRRKSSPFQHVWQCLIYSGVYLFQFARHMALLLKTSSALPAHHCIRQASRPQGCPPSRVLSLPTAGAHCSSRWYRRASDDQSGRGPATVYALRAHRLRVKLYSNHPLSNASLVAILLCKATPL